MLLLLGLLENNPIPSFINRQKNSLPNHNSFRSRGGERKETDSPLTISPEPFRATQAAAAWPERGSKAASQFTFKNPGGGANQIPVGGWEGNVRSKNH
ncbi:hypothetical protein V6N13_081241 [Hibiscus sabdariffa]